MLKILRALADSRKSFSSVTVEKVTAVSHVYLHIYLPSQQRIQSKYNFILCRQLELKEKENYVLTWCDVLFLEKSGKHVIHIYFYFCVPLEKASHTDL